MNSVLLVGRLIEKPLIKKANSGTEYAIVNVEVPKLFKKSEDDVECYSAICFGAVAKDTCDNLKANELVSLKGHLQLNAFEKDGETYYRNEIVAERIQSY